MSRFVFVKYFHKSIHMLVFNNYSCKNRKSKLHFGDRVIVLNVFLYQTGGSRNKLIIGENSSRSEK
jgi:hypothetical protein